MKMLKLSRQERLTGREIRQVFKRGEPFSCGPFKVVLLRGCASGGGGAFLARGCRHSAVLRNRLKRLLREVYRLNKNKLKEDVWMVLILEKPGSRLAFARLEADFLEICREAGILTGQAP